MLLQERSLLPSEHLTNELIEYRVRYQMAAVAAGLDAGHPLDQIRKTLRTADRRERASDRLSECLDVQASHEPEQLQLYFELVRELQSRVETTDPDTDELFAAIEDGTHPVLRVQQLSQRPAEFSDEEWQQTLGVIKETFGSQLAVAAARGRLSVREGVFEAAAITE